MRCEARTRVRQTVGTALFSNSNAMAENAAAIPPKRQVKRFLRGNRNDYDALGAGEGVRCGALAHLLAQFGAAPAAGREKAGHEQYDSGKPFAGSNSLSWQVPSHR
jgi:hypothetical protein